MADFSCLATYSLSFFVRCKWNLKLAKYFF